MLWFDFYAFFIISFCSTFPRDHVVLFGLYLTSRQCFIGELEVMMNAHVGHLDLPFIILYCWNLI